MEAGDCFRFCDRDEPHLWIVLSDPQQNSAQVLLVNLTTATRTKDGTCILRVGDHPYVRHDSCVNYHDARVATDASLDSLLARDRIRLEDKLDTRVLRKIREGALLSPRCSYEHREILFPHLS